ncbi:PASTA domain-containing protein [Nonomuraea sp. NPDC023979]|uniref:serine/threonine-protein kinase n=1 Tax=Nonomuraea sp. NPDC023979 TaxID=3154796 RepID=UPI0033E2CB23
MPTAQPLRTGDPRTLGPYALAGRLGEGGQGVVYLGTRDDDTYAVKLLHGPVGDERAAFLREVELAKHVARFCTAQVVDAGFDEGRAYIVSEYVDGPSLAREVMLTGPRRGGALERLAVGTATAIAAIHRAGIVHRDFKPQNVLLGSDGPRVIDFGLARALDAAATVSGRGVGTPAYMAPEQITASAVTGAADVFSWGATMCFAANGAAPFGQDSVAPVLHRILTAPPELGLLDGQLRVLVAACLDKDARNRPSSRDLLLALLGDSGGLPDSVLRSPPAHVLSASGVAVPAPRTDISGPEGPEGPGPTGGSVARSRPLAEPEATGAASGYRLPATPDAPAPSGGGRRAARRAGVAVAGALVVSVAILGMLLGPALSRDDRMPQGGGAAGPGATAATVSPVEEATPPEDEGRRGPGEPDPPVAKPARVPVPPLAGLSRAAAVRALQRAGLVAGQVSLVDSGRKIGLVLGSRPGAGVAVEKGAAVSLRVSAGVSVPALAGMGREAAEAAVAGAGLAVGPVMRKCGPEPDGRVLSTSPEAGSRVAGGTPVALTVSRRGVEVPSVIGRSREDAAGTLRGAGFEVTVQGQVVADESQVNLAIAQSLEAGGCARKGAAVVVTVGLAPQSGPDPSEPTGKPTGKPADKPTAAPGARAKP